jgi:hypothetical protein
LAESKLGQRLELGLVALSCLLFAASYGFNYGVDNQVVYLLKSLTLVDRGLLRADWYTSHATQYHPTFAYLGALLLWLRRDGWAIAIAQSAIIALGTFVIYGIVRAVAGVRHALVAFWLLLAVLFVTRTSSVMVSYIFDFILQPSTLGSLGLLGAMYYFIEERWLASGICLAGSGAFHVNYLVLGYPVFGLAQLALGTRGLWERLKLQFGPLVLVTIAVSPMLRKSASARGLEQAQQILFSVRSPHHYSPGTHERNFMPPAAYALFGIGAGWPILRSAPGKRLGALLAGFSAVVWTGTLLTTWIWVPRVAQLFVWRFAPFADLLNQILATSALAQLIARPARGKLHPPALLGACFIAVAVLGLFLKDHEDAPLPRLALAYLALGLLVYCLDVGLDLLTQRVPERLLVRVRSVLAWAGVPFALVALTFSARPKLQTIAERSTLLNPRNDATHDLYGWLANSSPRDAIFLTPPDIEGMRLLGKRAIVVDWKAAPILPRDLLEWYARISAVTGRAVSGSRDLAGYPALSLAQVLEVAHRYGASFVVERRQHAGRLSELAVVYQNPGYIVFRMP